MKKIVFYFTLIPLFCFGQNDKLILVDGDTLEVTLTELAVKVIKYHHLNGDLNYSIKKNKVVKIIHDSGKVEILNSRLANKINSNTEEVGTITPFFQIGIINGASQSIIKGMESSSTLGGNMLIDDLYGLYAQYTITERLSFKSKLIRHVKGESFDDSMHEVWLEYYELPVMAEFSFNKNKFDFFIDVGIYFSVLNDAEIKLYVQGGPFWFDYPLDEYQFAQNPYPSFDFGAILGVGMGYKISERFRLLADVSVEQGLSFQKKLQIFDGKNINFSVPVSLGLGYKINN